MTLAAIVVGHVGSLRRESLAHKVVDSLIALSSASLEFQYPDIGKLPHYNPDLESENAPTEWVSFRRQIKYADAYLFATPEYNRSMSGVLKDALDVASRHSERTAGMANRTQ